MTPGAASGSRVIVAEDDLLIRGVIRSVLAHVSQQVFVATNGNEAIALAGQFTARLVLLDIGMPDLNGLLACEAIRGLPGYDGVPIVMLTGYCDDRMRLAAKQLGANDYITKPFVPDALLARVGAYLGAPEQPWAGTTGVSRLPTVAAAAGGDAASN